jgi:FkbM family methyltransferase
MSLQRLRLSLAWKTFPWAAAQIKTARGVRVPLQARGDFPALAEIFVQQAYAPLLAALPEPVTSWVDLGCNAGMFSAWLYDRACAAGVGAECRALLVEPGSCIETAREMVRLNGLKDRFQVVRACVGDGAPVVFYESKSSTRSSSAIKPPSREKQIRMETRTVTSLLDGHLPQADLIKIDIEGAEKFVLREAEILPRFRAGIIEWHAETTSGADVAAWIAAAGGQVVHAVAQDGTTGDPLQARLGMLAWSRAGFQ